MVKKLKGWKKGIFNRESKHGTVQFVKMANKLPKNSQTEKYVVVKEDRVKGSKVKLFLSDACDANTQVDIELADQCFLRNDFKKAVEKYDKVLNKLSDNGYDHSEISGDINVKVSNILQGQGDLPLALNHLLTAREIYRTCVENIEDDNNEVLAAKLLETVMGIANIYVDQGEINNAADTYQDAVKMSRKLPNSGEHVASVLMNYGNFLSICRQDHNGAIDTLKEALKLQLKSTNEMNHSSAYTLNCMGKVYMRKSKATNSKEAIKDAEKAEACFLRALQFFRFSMVNSGNEKVIDTLCNLNEARERQTKKEGILRNVRFDPSTFQNTEENNVKSEPSSDSAESSCYSSDEDVNKCYSDLSEEKKNCSDLLGFFKCGGAEECRDDI